MLNRRERIDTLEINGIVIVIQRRVIVIAQILPVAIVEHTAVDRDHRIICVLTFQINHAGDKFLTGPLF